LQVGSRNRPAIPKWSCFADLTGRSEAHLIDAKKMLNSHALREDWHLQPGDFIYVPQSRISKIRKFVPASSMNGYLNPLQF